MATLPAACAAAIIASCQIVNPPPPPPPVHAAWSAPEVVTIQGRTGMTEDPYVTKDGDLLFDDAGAASVGGAAARNRSQKFRALFAHNQSASQLSPHFAKKIDYKTFTYVGPVDVGTGGNAAPTIDDAGNLYFLSGRSYPTDNASIWRGTFVNGTVTDLKSVPSIHKNTAGCMNMGATPSRDGAYMVFSDNCPPGTSRIVIAARNADGTFTRLANSDTIMATVNTVRGKTDFGYVASLSSDNLEIFWTAPGTSATIWTAQRTKVSEPFGVAVPINTGTEPGLAEGSGISADGKHLYYFKEHMGETKLYVLSRP